MIDYATRYKGARGRVLALLSDLEWHTWRELEATAGNRYGSRIRELKRLGYPFESEDLEDGKKYRLTSAEPTSPRGKKVRVYLDEVDAIGCLTTLIPVRARQAIDAGLKSFQANRSKL